MSLKEWAEVNGLTEVYNQYVEDCEEISEQCVQEGYPSRGSNYELRVEGLRQSYPELFAADDEDEEETS